MQRGWAELGSRYPRYRITAAGRLALYDEQIAATGHPGVVNRFRPMLLFAREFMSLKGVQKPSNSLRSLAPKEASRSNLSKNHAEGKHAERQTKAASGVSPR